MRRIYPAILLFICLTSCNDENAPGCLKTAGGIQKYNIELAEFTTIDVHNNINVVIEQGSEQSVKLTAGKNLASNITFEIIEGNLVIKDENKCNWARDYSKLNVHIVTDQLSKIRSSGGGTISSKGILSFPNKLTLISELYTGDFVLDVSLQSLAIVNNDLSNYYISGSVTQLNVGFYAGDGRFEGRNLAAEDTRIVHYGTNDMIINASNSLTGEIKSTGDLIYCTIPTVLDVEIIDDRGELIHSCD